MSSSVSLADIDVAAQPQLSHFHPPPRFGNTRFSSYKPQHPSQYEALQHCQRFIDSPLATNDSFRWFWQEALPAKGEGLYLDGGFGVGKTHLLAAAFHASAIKHKAYLSFQELVYTIGALGKEKAKEAFAPYQLLCIDEFELDDPGNTLIVKSFLADAFARGSKVITTSNTPPAAQGEGRFNARDFQREIQSIAERFSVLSLEGPDYRHRDHMATLLDPTKLEQQRRQASSSQENQEAQKVVYSGWNGLLQRLQSLHPSRYGNLLQHIGQLYVQGVTTIDNQNDALRFVHFIDKLYDMQVAFQAAGDVALEDIFDASYRQGAYAKKHYRCLSRLSELLEETNTPIPHK